MKEIASCDIRLTSLIGPAGRLGEPDDIAENIAFLASDESVWITSQVLSIDGGFCLI